MSGLVEADQQHPIKPLEVALAALVALAFELAYRVRYGVVSAPSADGQKYQHMVEHGLRPCIAQPFCWRVAVPVTVRVLPLSTRAGFTLVTFTAIVVAASLVFVIARHLSGLGLVASYGAVVAFVSMPGGVRDLVHNPFLIDPVTWVAVGLTVVLAVRRQAIAFAVVLLLAVLAKENQTCLVVLFYGLAAERFFDRKVLARTALAAVPALAALLALRATIAARGTLTLTWSVRHFGGRTLGTFAHHQPWAVAELLNRWFFTSYGIAILVLVAFGVWANRTLALRLAPFVLIALIHPFLAGNIERDMMLAAVPMAWLAALGVPELARRGLGWAGIAVLFVAAIAPFLAFRSGSSQQGFGVPVFEVLALGVVAIAVVIAQVLSHRDRRQATRVG